MDIIPMFPLSIVAFPGEVINLHIFEARYKQLVHDCFNDGSTFGIPPYIEGESLDYGTELTILEIVKRYDDGKMDVKALGIGWYKIDTFYRVMEGKLYPGAIIDRMPWNDNIDIFNNQKLIALIEELYNIMSITNVRIEPVQTFRSYQIAHKLGLNIEQEIHFMKLENEIDRLEYLIYHLQNLIPVVKAAENLRKRAELNGHFQNVIPPNF